MKVVSIRRQLQDFIAVAEEKKVKAIYTILEEDIAQSAGYSEDFKKELDSRLEYYKKGGKMVSPSGMEKNIKRILKSNKAK